MLAHAKADRLLEGRIRLRVGTGQQSQTVEAIEHRRQVQLALLTLPFDRGRPGLQRSQGRHITAAEHRRDKLLHGGQGAVAQCGELRPVAPPEGLLQELQGQIGMLGVARQQHQTEPIGLIGRLQVLVQLLQMVFQQQALHRRKQAGEYLFAGLVGEQLLGGRRHLPVFQTLQALLQIEGLALQQRQPQALQLELLGRRIPSGAWRDQAATQNLQPLALTGVATELLQHQIAPPRQQANRLAAAAAMAEPFETLQRFENFAQGRGVKGANGRDAGAHIAQLTKQGGFALPRERQRQHIQQRFVVLRQHRQGRRSYGSRHTEVPTTETAKIKALAPCPRAWG